MKKKKPVKLVYKKSLFEQLVMLDNNFLYSARNRNNEKYQIFAFEDTPKLRKDIAELTGHKYREDFQ